MIYLKNLNGQVKEHKNTDAKTVDALLDSGRWIRVKGRKDSTPYTGSKKTIKKTIKKKSARKWRNK